MEDRRVTQRRIELAGNGEYAWDGRRWIPLDEAVLESWAALAGDTEPADATLFGDAAPEVAPSPTMLLAMGTCLAALIVAMLFPLFAYLEI